MIATATVCAEIRRCCGVTVLLHNEDDVVEIVSIQVPVAERRQGLGTAAMAILCREADANGWPMRLTPDSCFGTPEAALRAWYHRFGFRGGGVMIRPVHTPMPSGHSVVTNRLHGRTN